MASRVLNVRGRGTPVVVSLEAPEVDPQSDRGDWRCAFRITGRGSPRLRFGCGIDAFSSVFVALDGIRHTLEPYRADLSWAGGGLELAFPRFVPGGLPGRFAERIEGLIDRKLALLAQSLERRAKKQAAKPAAAPSRGRAQGDRARSRRAASRSTVR